MISSAWLFMMSLDQLSVALHDLFMALHELRVRLLLLLHCLEDLLVCFHELLLVLLHLGEVLGARRCRGGCGCACIVQLWAREGVRHRMLHGRHRWCRLAAQGVKLLLQHLQPRLVWIVHLESSERTPLLG